MPASYPTRVSAADESKWAGQNRNRYII